MPVCYYTGDHIYFRPLELEDEPTVRRWINDPRIWATLTPRGPLNACREREWIEGQGKSPNDYVFAIARKENDQHIGQCGLHAVHWIHRTATFGTLIGEIEQQDHGFGREATELTVRYAFEVLNLNRVALEVFDNNPRGVRVYEKVGFQLEGRFRQGAWLGGRYVDVLRYAILREDWASRPPRHSAGG